MNWKILNSSYPFICPWLKVRKDVVRLPNGIDVPDFYITEAPDWVNVIAITADGKFIIEEQYRHGLQKVCCELCAGVVEFGEEPIEAAKRELLEETGYAGGEWSYLGSFATNARGANNYCHSFLARGVELVARQRLDKTEDIVIHLISEHEIRALLDDNQIQEGVMAAPLWKYFANI